MEEALNTTVKPESRVHSFLRRHVNGVDIFASIIILLLVMTTTMFWLRYQEVQGELLRIQSSIKTQQTNVQVLNFMQLFIDKVLKAPGEIDFETRLNLESAVRALNDQQILAAWQAFTGAQTEPAAQDAVKNLLGLLAYKMK